MDICTRQNGIITRQKQMVCLGPALVTILTSSHLTSPHLARPYLTRPHPQRTPRHGRGKRRTRSRGPERTVPTVPTVSAVQMKRQGQKQGPCHCHRHPEPDYLEPTSSRKTWGRMTGERAKELCSRSQFFFRLSKSRFGWRLFGLRSASGTRAVDCIDLGYLDECDAWHWESGLD